jgi:hypothetical protein
VAAGETKELIAHFLGNFIAVLVLFGAAVGCSYVETWCISQKLPDYLCLRVKAISIVLFTIDGIVICGTAAIIAYKLLKRMIQNDV